MDPYDITETLKLAQSIPAMPSLGQLESLMDFDPDEIDDEFLLPDLDEVQEILGLDVFKDDIFGNGEIRTDSPSSSSASELENSESSEISTLSTSTDSVNVEANGTCKMPPPLKCDSLEHNNTYNDIKKNDPAIESIPREVLQSKRKFHDQTTGQSSPTFEAIRQYNGLKIDTTFKNNKSNSVPQNLPSKFSQNTNWKCSSSNCSKSAVYGEMLNIPSHCKKHASKGMIHIKKWFPLSDANPMTHAMFAQFMTGLFSVPVSSRLPKLVKIAPASNTNHEGGKMSELGTNFPTTNIPQMPQSSKRKNLVCGSETFHKDQPTTRSICVSDSDSESPGKKVRRFNNAMAPDIAELNRFRSFTDPAKPLEDISDLPVYGEDIHITPDVQHVTHKQPPKEMFDPQIPAPAITIPPTPKNTSYCPIQYIDQISMKKFLVEKGLEPVSECISKAYENDMKVLVFSASDREQFDQDLTSLGVKLYHRRKLLMVLKELSC